MREILFRGKPVYNKRYKWVHDDGFCYGAPAVPYKSLFYAYYKPYEDDEDCAAMLVDIDPDTIGQYTGLTANGKKIFEGDIIRANHDRAVGVVRFGEYMSPSDPDPTRHIGYYVDWQGKEKDFLRADLGYWSSRSDVEVIGNIHDNPELLEAGE